MGKLTYMMLWVALGGFGLVAHLPAAPPAPVRPAAPPPTPAAPHPIGPSRYAGADVKDYVEQLASKFSSATRVTDPFGQPQDPEAKLAAKPTVTRIPRRFAPVVPTALSEIVGQLNITMVKPKARRFVVDNRDLGVGDKLPLTFRNVPIQTEITEVSASRIVFRNMETGELGIYKFGGLPPGISRDKDALKMPTVRPNAPLEIDAPPLPSANNPNP